MSDNNTITKKDEYSLLCSLINNAESISWNRFNSFLLFNSIIILAWATVYSKSTPLPILQSTLTILGLIGCFFWCALGLRGRKNVNMFLEIGRKIETDSTGEKPLTKAEELRDKQPFSWAGSVYIITIVPLFIAALYAILLWLSITNLIMKIVFITIAIVLIIVFLCLTLGYIKRGKKNL